MEIIIKDHELQDAVTVSQQIPEFNEPYPVDEYVRRLSGVPHYILTAYVEGRPVGFKVGYEREGTFYSWMGGVLPQFRQEGIGDRLAERQEQWARQKGYTRVTIKTRKKYKAMLGLLKKRGYRVLRTIPKQPAEETRIWLEKVL
jgi:ribosomal protein S18 acetylase RimI-like enzyme